MSALPGLTSLHAISCAVHLEEKDLWNPFKPCAFVQNNFLLETVRFVAINS